jgi:dTDP-4-dehydrorhamnose reductase
MFVLADRNPIGLGHDEIDIEDGARVESVLAKLKPTLVINTAAFHNLEECERQPHRAFAVNVVATDRLSRAVQNCGAAFATMSTDYVFDGKKGSPYTEGDEPRPINLYGLSRLCGELNIARFGPRYFLFRTSGLFGVRETPGSTRFIETVIIQARAGQCPRVVNDLVFSPSYAVDVALAMRRAFEKETFGLYHVTNTGECSWFELAVEALKLVGVGVEVLPISYKDYGSLVPRPTYTALDHEALRRIGVDMPSWRDGLSRHLQSAVAG